MIELTRAIEAQRNIHEIHKIPQIAFLMSGKWKVKEPLVLHSFEECKRDKKRSPRTFI